MNVPARSLEALPVSNSFAALPTVFYTRVAPQPPGEPRLLHANPDAAALIGLDPAVLDTPQFLRVFSGLEPLPGGVTLAAVYSGHQFGVWAGQLGDGRAHLLGEVAGPGGAWELQLKGAGRTPYSRMADGRAVLRSSVREYLAAEAMHGLGIPTTRSLALVVSDEPVVRETVETAAVVTRMAPSFVRFGSFEHWAARREPERLRTLVDYVIDRHYPECRDAPAGEADSPDGAVLRWLRAVVARTAELMAGWQAVGFCHGVMNTDNMSILGLTLDYGPYGFMDAFQAGHVCNHSDTEGRYAWNGQPAVAHWNLYRLASSLHALVPDADGLRAALDTFEPVFTEAFHRRLAAKLGLAAWEPGDDDLMQDLWRLMHANRADFTLSFRFLSAAAQGRPTSFENLYADREAARAWLARYGERLDRDGRDPAERARDMDRANPLYVLRNHLAELAIRAAAQGDASEIDTLLALLRDPFQERQGAARYAELPPDWAGGLQVSCSS